jgi:hypothetical protein
MLPGADQHNLWENVNSCWFGYRAVTGINLLVKFTICICLWRKWCIICLHYSSRFISELHNIKLLVSVVKAFGICIFLMLLGWTFNSYDLKLLHLLFNPSSNSLNGLTINYYCISSLIYSSNVSQFAFSKQVLGKFESENRSNRAMDYVEIYFWSWI